MSSSSAKRLITVIGATGAQGGGVVRALLSGGGGAYKVRAVTRSPDGEAAKQLRAQGVEVVGGDVTNKEDLNKAFQGAYAAFAVTTFGHGVTMDEFTQGKNMVDAAKQQNVQHFVFSSLENAEKISKGTHHVPHFTLKAQVDDYIQKVGIPSTSVQMAAYYENFATMLTPQPTKSGEYEFGLPIPSDAKFALGSVDELGLVVAKVLEDREKFLGKKVAVAGEFLSPNQIAEIYTKVWNKPVKAKYIPREVYAKFYPGADEIAEMFDFFDKFGVYGEKTNGRDMYEGKKLVPSLSTFEQWLTKNMPHPPAPKTQQQQQ